MPANINPIFTITPNCFPAVITAANLASDGSGSLVTIVTAGTNGTRVDAVKFTNSQATQAASSAMLVKVFVSDVNGANPRIVGETTMAAATRSATVAGATATVTLSPAQTMKSGQIMYASISIHAGAQDDTVASPNAGDF